MRLGEIPEIKGMKQAGMSEDEIRRIGSKPTGAAFLSERLDDVNTLADPNLQESIRQLVEEPETLVDITPISD